MVLSALEVSKLYGYKIATLAWFEDICFFFVKTCRSEICVTERARGLCFRRMPHCLQRLHYAHKQFETFLTAQLHSEHMILGLQVPSTLIWMLQYCLMPLIFPSWLRLYFYMIFRFIVIFLCISFLRTSIYFLFNQIILFFLVPFI